MARHKISKTFEGICTNSSFNLSFKLPISKSEHQQVRAPKTVIQHFDRPVADHMTQMNQSKISLNDLAYSNERNLPVEMSIRWFTF